MNLATNQRAQRRDRTNVYMCHLDHLLRLPRARRRRVPPTEAARPKFSLKDDVDCGASKASSCPLYGRLRARIRRGHRKLLSPSGQDIEILRQQVPEVGRYLIVGIGDVGERHADRERGPTDLCQRAVSLISNWTSTASASVATLAIAR